MKKAMQAPTKKFVGIVLAAVIGFIGLTKNDNTTSFEDSTVDSAIVVIQEPKIEIQKQQVNEVIHPTDSREKYIVRSGDNMYKIARSYKPKNVSFEDYHSVLIDVNSTHKLHINQEIIIPNDHDLKDVILPEIEILFSIHNEDFIDSIKHSEGSSKIQSVLKRKLLGGEIGAPFKNDKFYPYRDSNGNFTIGYGHYLGKDPKNALKYSSGITRAQATVILKKDMKRVLKEYTVLLQKKRADSLTYKQQKILFEMAFTLGTDKLSTFEKMWKNVHNEDKFKHEIRNSLWYKQVGERAERILS